MGDRLRPGIPPRYVTKPTRSTQPCIPLGSLNRVPALIGWGNGGNVTSAGWQVTLCDLIWHVSSRSGAVLVAQTATRYASLPSRPSRHPFDGVSRQNERPINSGLPLLPVHLHVGPTRPILAVNCRPQSSQVKRLVSEQSAAGTDGLVEPFRRLCFSTAVVISTTSECCSR